MTATNHVVTGAIIGATIHNPLLAIPVAFFAHFALDALPHFGMDKAGISHRSRTFLYILVADMAIALAVLISIVGLGLPSWPVLVACGIACASPDLMWLWPWIHEVQGHEKQSMGKVRSFHSRIQWCERPWGLAVEIVWFVAGLALLGFIAL